MPLLLFAASAGFIVWRNTQVGVLVDIAYVLNTATRIAAGDVPYAQFPLVLAPGEFLIQALLIKAFGPHFLVQIAYATILGGLATVFTYAIARRPVRLLQERDMRNIRRAAYRLQVTDGGSRSAAGGRYVRHNPHVP